MFVQFIIVTSLYRCFNIVKSTFVWLLGFVIVKKTFSSPDHYGSVGCWMVGFPIRAHAWDVGSGPGQGVYERQPIDIPLTSGRNVFLPPLPSL